MQSRPLRCSAIGLFAVIAAAALSGCASSPSSQAAGYAQSMGGTNRTLATLPGKPACFWLRNFDGSWTVLNDSELIVHAPLQSRPYLIKLFEPVMGLRFHERLGFEDTGHTGMICNDSMDDLVVPHWQPHRVPITAVRALTKPQADHLLAENHIEVPARPQPHKTTPPAKH